MFSDGGQLSVGNPEIDREHEALFGQAREIITAVIKGISREQLLPRYEAFLTATKGHFDHEERILAPCNLPHFEAHKDEHKELLRALSSLKDSMENDEDEGG